MDRNILLTIEYDGTWFSGWQRQPSRRTVQGELERVLSILCAGDIHINGVSRTDAGVHAYGQRATFCGSFSIPTGNIKRAANNLLAAGGGPGRPGDVRIVHVEEKPPGFHARFDAKGKKYKYKIYNAAEMDVFRRNYFYRVEAELNLEAMKRAAGYIEGAHDFKCFQAAGGQEKETTVRTVSSIKIDVDDLCDGATGEIETASGRCITIEVAGDGFLYNMVRIISGTLVDVGRGRIDPESLPDIINSKDRQNAGHTAPPQGLYLAEVYY